MGDSPLYPIMLKLAGKPCTVIGGGKVAARKIRHLLASGAKVKVVSPILTPELWHFVNNGIVMHVAREYEEGDAIGALLVFAATDDSEVNERVAAEARRCGALINVAHSPDHSDFANPGAIQHGDVHLAVSTGGASPTLTRSILAKLSKLMDEELAQVAELLLHARKAAHAVLPDTAQRQRAMRHYAEECWRAYEQHVPLPKWEEWIEAWLAQLSINESII
ncbi:precorrin-2 dehydrogenase/sirohydrochlorin ferrochelatase family protein [Paenibacillus alvei]|uniref:precorrin-2 dehydrogenase n=1 Tax=Paenibacillus alvei TaxID=44250 RepID=A0AAP6ZZG3_PAEAL|nr:bifunctional precorrin-2 dehydrogenase/sirohydrochlorin ferrochelatase [Paenibacillus alvei]MBG9734524.1 siroheme synthase [Paenibacillus alvei]MBG9743165.1 siroheme synthase [Paenibacillus alvei]MCY9579522.1 bifunctional precorrin-2 dehydrogenase/sirohydrochlorin ferrochelatase [Paenibacillus alvei]MCY9586481.1 bifunctional precorrin-2 dehydrogenase/sirohydrochlorin ferrochelatase [Paenibacillus alvei]NEZ43839.1 bifunctional precorrin-2 dehydrogenase/sirohydrochlorin ferrochelatase [Paenib